MWISDGRNFFLLQVLACVCSPLPAAILQFQLFLLRLPLPSFPFRLSLSRQPLPPPLPSLPLIYVRTLKSLLLAISLAKNAVAAVAAIWLIKPSLLPLFLLSSEGGELKGGRR